MKKIMFEDNLEAAVICGVKTMTRRIVPIRLYNQTDWKEVAEGNYEAVVDGEGYYHDIRKCGMYDVGDIVALAQSYKHVSMSCNKTLGITGSLIGMEKIPGWNNKMFVRADLMPHQIRITDVKIELLHSISDEDCLKEGVAKRTFELIKSGEVRISYRYAGQVDSDLFRFCTPQEAFGEMLDKVIKKKIWNKPDYNPWVFAYSFELIR